MNEMKPRVKIALGSYDRHGPFLEGAIEHPLFDFEFLELDPHQGRHERFLQQFEFDACELSFSSYVVAVDQGVPVHAVITSSPAATQVTDFQGMP